MSKDLLKCSSTEPPIVPLLAVEFLKLKINVEWGKSTSLSVGGQDVSSDLAIARYLIRTSKGSNLYGSDDLTAVQVDHWLDFAAFKLGCKSSSVTALEYLNKILAPCTYLVGEDVTLADFAVWSKLRTCDGFLKSPESKHENVRRYYQHMNNLPQINKVLSSLPAVAAVRGSGKETTGKESTKKKDEGKFVELEGAERGKVIVRFPPEASGYLHIGHAKAALLNQYYQQEFDGKLIMRFDDTNPAKEDADFEKIILEDVKLLGIEYDIFSHTSNHFELMLTLCEKMIKEGSAFVDDTDGEKMKEERSVRVNSVHRDNDVDKNMRMWDEMKRGTEFGQKCCVRAKIDMSSDNGCMRDPTMYRCKPETHPHTGNKYKVYPTYDFACPIVDSVEGVTHALRTTEYLDRDFQYNWFIDRLQLRRPRIWAYSRLNLQHTVLSKRKLTWFVNEGYVSGWDDPRFPTVRGVLRRGMTVEGLKQFIVAQGGSRSVVTMEWDKIWSFNKKVIDPIAPRYFALLRKNMVPVFVDGVLENSELLPLHPKNESVGSKKVYYASKVYIEGADADDLKINENVTFINWGNLIITEITRKGDKIVSLKAKTNLDNKDFKKTTKITWLADHTESDHIPTRLLHYGDLLTKPVLAPGDDFKDFINRDSMEVFDMLGDPGLVNLKKGDIIQLQRRGYYICDVPAGEWDVSTSTRSPCVLINIPDGHQKEMPTSGAKQKGTGASGSSKGKEKSVSFATPPSVVSPAQINEQIVKQGNVVRELKSQKAHKETIEGAVQNLLSLKVDYKKATGREWKPGCTPPADDASASASTMKLKGEINDGIVAQGQKVRALKSAKASKADIDAAVKTLWSLKADYKAVAGQDWSPELAPPVPTSNVPEKSAGGEQAGKIDAQIVEQGTKVRELKSAKGNKADIDAAVKTLLSLKADYKAVTGQDWKPGCAPSAIVQTPSPASGESKSAGYSAADLDDKITAQGTKVRGLKAAKASKSDTEAEVKVLLSLKAEYKKCTGQDWKPGCVSPVEKPAPQAGSFDSGAENLNDAIAAQGNKVRQLKSEKAGKEVITKEVKQLLTLKTEYKNQTGQDWKPGMAPSPVSTSAGDGLNENITKQGDRIRTLKGQKAEKAVIEAEVKILLELKAKYKSETGQDWKPAGGAAPREQKPKQKAVKKEEKAQAPAAAAAGDREVKKITKLGLMSLKEENLSDWYSQVITKADMIEYYDVSGCYILKPWSYSIWEAIKDFFDREIKKLEVENCYFPMFVSNAALEREKTHIADFAPEVAWVTKSGTSDLIEPIAIRPTSETVMYPAYAKWIQSHRDLPLKLNQWNNIVRWEFKHPQPFLRTREFLWQEGHTAYAQLSECQEEVLTILDLYRQIYEDLLAIPVVTGKKTDKEKFAGGDYTTTCEAFISASGRAIQGATSHHLGQNFSKMFNIVYEDPETNKPQYVYQNSWGITTRTIGVMVMVHGDNKGLVLPPNVACVQAIIIPCGVTASMKEEDKVKVMDSCKKLVEILQSAGIKAKGDYRDNYSPGWKYNHWELKGVPIRIEVGPRDVSSNQFVAVRRDTSEKINMKKETGAEDIKKLLATIQKTMFNKAKIELDTHIVVAKNWEQLCNGLDKNSLILAPFCGDISCEEAIKKDSARDVVVEEGAPAMGAKGLCIPFKPPAEITAEDKCVYPACSRKPQYYTLFGRSY